MELKVDFNFIQDTIINHTHEGAPIIGDLLRITINKQEFRKAYSLISYSIKKPSYRDKATLFAENLKEIAEEILRQAKHGKPGKIKTNTKTIYYF